MQNYVLMRCSRAGTGDRAARAGREAGGCALCDCGLWCVLIVIICTLVLKGDGIALAVDMTARNVQDAVKKKGLPWSTAKGFDTFTPVG